MAAPRTRKPAVTAPEEPEFEPVVLHSTPDKDVERVHLFSIEDDDGEVKDYYARKQVGFNVSLKAMKIFAERGEEASQAFALTAVIGDEGYEALVNHDDLTEEDFLRILQYAEQVVLAPAAGKSQNRAQRRARTRGKR